MLHKSDCWLLQALILEKSELIELSSLLEVSRIFRNMSTGPLKFRNVENKVLVKYGRAWEGRRAR